MPELMSIGRFSQVSGLTVKALRLYDQRGILRPAAVDFTSGYRYYSPSQIRLAVAIRLLRESHMSLAEIHVMLTAEQRNHIEALLSRHRDRIETRIGEYERALAQLPCADDWCAITGKGDSMTDKSRDCRCSFCAKDRSEVRRMIAGPNGVFICNECVALCNQVIEDAEREESKVSGSKA